MRPTAPGFRIFFHGKRALHGGMPRRHCRCKFSFAPKPLRPNVDKRSIVCKGDVGLCDSQCCKTHVTPHQKEEWSKFGENQLFPGKVENIGNIDLWTVFRTQEEQWSNFASFNFNWKTWKTSKPYFFYHDQIVESHFFYPEENQQKLKSVFLGNVWDTGDRVAKESLNFGIFQLRSNPCPFFRCFKPHRIRVWYIYVTIHHTCTIKNPPNASKYTSAMDPMKTVTVVFPGATSSEFNDGNVFLPRLYQAVGQQCETNTWANRGAFGPKKTNWTTLIGIGRFENWCGKNRFMLETEGSDPQAVRSRVK